MPRHKTLPPEPKAGDGSPEGKFLEEYKEIYASGERLILPPDYKQSPGLIGRGRGVIVKNGKGKNEGKLVFRVPGVAGPDLDRLPASIEVIRAEQAYISEINKAHRHVRFLKNKPKAAVSRKLKADKNEAMVMALVAQHASKGSNLAAYIAKRTGLTPRRVRQIIFATKKGK